MSRSYQQFRALALPAASVPPSRVASTRPSGGRPRAASIIVGTVVTSSSSMIRGLVSATYAATTPPARGLRTLPGRASSASVVTGRLYRRGPDRSCRSLCPVTLGAVPRHRVRPLAVGYTIP